MFWHEICSLSLNPHQQPITNNQSSKSIWTSKMSSKFSSSTLLPVPWLMSSSSCAYLRYNLLNPQPLPSSSCSEQCLWNNPSKIDLTVPFLLKNLESFLPHRKILTSHWKPPYILVVSPQPLPPKYFLSLNCLHFLFKWFASLWDVLPQFNSTLWSSVLSVLCSPLA